MRYLHGLVILAQRYLHGLVTLAQTIEQVAMQAASLSIRHI